MGSNFKLMYSILNKCKQEKRKNNNAMAQVGRITYFSITCVYLHFAVSIIAHYPPDPMVKFGQKH